MTLGAPSVPVWVELSGENLALAELELFSCGQVLDPLSTPPRSLPWGNGRFREVSFSRAGPTALLSSRLAFAHRVLRPIAEGSLDTLVDAMVLEGGSGASGRVRVAPGAPPSLASRVPGLLGHAFLQGGGRVDLDAPDRDFLAFLSPTPSDPDGAAEAGLAELLGEVPRSEVELRRSKHRPFRKPVTLPPRLARAMVNLAEAPLGGTVLDPFCGTGSILLEASHLGYRVTGADVDAEMVRGTLQNLSAAGLAPERVVQRRVSELADQLEGVPFDAAVFDPPYGRASTTGGEGSSEVLRQALQAMPRMVRPGGHVVLLVSDPEGVPAKIQGLRRETLMLAERVHRSLTRWVVVLTVADA